MRGGLCAALLIASSLLLGQDMTCTITGLPAWLASNYRHAATPVAAPSQAPEAQRRQTLRGQISELQHQSYMIMRQARLEDNLGAAIEAVQQAQANAELMARAAAPTPAAASLVYLIALEDHTIRAVRAWWVEGGTLHYIDLQGRSGQVPLSSVDRALTEQLNRERNVPFALPK